MDRARDERTVTELERLGNYRFQLLLKEMELIQQSIHNMDDIIHKNKNFAFVAWGGSLYLIVEHLNNLADPTRGALIFLTGFIPLIFWVMDVQYRSHIRRASAREKKLTYFINSEDFFEQIVRGVAPLQGYFPQYDIVGWSFTDGEDSLTQLRQRALTDRLNQAAYFMAPKREKLRLRNAFFYKEAKWFYATLLVLSSVLGSFYIWT